MPLPSRVILIGYRGCGKTTVARQLAHQLAYDWVDSDVEVELQAGCSIAAIFAQQGEAAFRDLEENVIARLCQRDRTVLALGGGAVLRPENRQLLAHAGPVVWLTATIDTIARRLDHDPLTQSQRPQLTSDGGKREIELILQQRMPIYQACATLEVDTEEKTPAQIATEIIDRLASSLG